MMPRYIDANALISDSRICGNCKDHELCDGNIAFCPSAAARRAINDAPTVDAEPVRHGRWINCVNYNKIDDAINYGYTICSVCEKLQQYGYKAKYCPNCGAKMDGGDE